MHACAWNRKPWRRLFAASLARAVAVNSQFIIEALRKVYDASALADELLKR